MTRVDERTLTLLFFNFGNERISPGLLASIRFEFSGAGEQAIRFRAEGTFMSTARARLPEAGLTLTE